MFDKLQGIEDKLEKINSSLCDPEVVSNQEEYKKLMREAKTLTPIVEKFREYKKANSDLTEAKEMLETALSIRNSEIWQAKKRRRPRKRPKS